MEDIRNKEESNIIDYGSITVPTKWEEVTLKQFQEIEKYYSDKDKKFDIRDVLHIFTNKSVDEINELPMEFLEDIMAYLMFIHTNPTEKEPRNWIEIDGERYTVHTESKLKVGEYIGADTILKNDSHNYAALLAILCRKDGELYDSHFENEVLEDRIKMWEERPVTDVLPLIGFFLELYVVSVMPTLLSSKVVEAIDLTRKDIETLRANGGISKRSMKSAMKKLRKLEKSINNI